MKLSEILAGNPDLAALAAEKTPPADPPTPQVNPPESAAADVTATVEQLEEEGLVKPKRRGRKSNAEKAAEAAAKDEQDVKEAAAKAAAETSRVVAAKPEPAPAQREAGFEGEIVAVERLATGYRITIEGAGQAVIGRKVRIL